MGSSKEFDPVTGLPFFEEFMRKARMELRNPPQGRKYVMISSDINNFKYINKMYGFEKADELLMEGIKLLYSQDYHLISSCRTHSDHIISLAYYEHSKEELQANVERFADAFVKDNESRYPSIALHLNNGLYYIEDNNEDLMFIMDKANVARRVAKGNYCVGSVVFTPEMLDRKAEDAKILALFDDALKNDRIEVRFQPKINVRTHEICGAEALSRIYDAEGNMLYPDSYIPTLENSGKVVDLDWYVIRHVFAYMEMMIREGHKMVPISVNLSRMHFYEQNLAQKLYDEFSKHDIPIQYVEFELTESLFFADGRLIVEEVKRLRDFGFKVSIDDFGVGYSNLNSLSSLPVDIIKFDKGFVHSSMKSDSGYLIMQSLIQVMRQINYHVICEGIETTGEEQQIADCGCDVVQGFLYDKPITEEAFSKKYLM